MAAFLRKMLNVDRRVIFVLIAISVIIPLFVDYKQDITPDDTAIQYHLTVEQLKAKDKQLTVLLSGQMDPGTVPELMPMAKSTIMHLFRINARIVIIGLWPQGPPLIMEALNDLLKTEEFRDKKYGIDYVNLGYTTGGAVIIKGLAREIRDKFPVDVNGTKLDALPMMEGIHNFDNFDLIVNLSAGSPGSKEFVQFAKKTNGELIDIVSGCTAVQAPEAYPYINAKQIKGLLGGLKGAADYEKLLNEPDKATKYMFAQSIAHIVIMLFIIIGNLAFFILRRREH